MDVLSQLVLDPAPNDAPPAATARYIAEAQLAVVVSSAPADAPGEGAGPLDPSLASACANLIADVLCNHMSQEVALLKRHQGLDREKLRERVTEALRISVRRASREAHALTSRRDARIASTLDAALVVGDLAFVCHVGDGRVYLYRQALLHGLTRDHLAVRSANDGEHRRLIRAVGLHPGVEPETVCLQLTHRDRLLLLSPWLHRAVPEALLRERASDPSPEVAAAQIIAAARADAPTAERDLAAMLVDLRTPGVEPEVYSGGRARLRTLSQVPLFAYCTEPELLAIGGMARPRTVAAGGTIFEDGDPGRELFLVVSGAVQIIKGDKELARLGPGSNFGEMAMLDESSRSAGARALQRTELLVMDRESFMDLLKGDPTLAVKVLWNMLLRLSANLRTTSARLAAIEAE